MSRWEIVGKTSTSIILGALIVAAWVWLFIFPCREDVMEVFTSVGTYTMVCVSIIGCLYLVIKIWES